MGYFIKNSSKKIVSCLILSSKLCAFHHLVEISDKIGQIVGELARNCELLILYVQVPINLLLSEIWTQSESWICVSDMCWGWYVRCSAVDRKTSHLNLSSNSSSLPHSQYSIHHTCNQISLPTIPPLLNTKSSTVTTN